MIPTIKDNQEFFKETFERAKQLQLETDGFYDNVAENLQGASTEIAKVSPREAKKTPIPFDVFHSQQHALNEQLKNLYEIFADIVRAAQGQLTKFWESSDPGLPDELKAQVKSIIQKAHIELDTLLITSKIDDPIEHLLTVDDKISVLGWEWEAPKLDDPVLSIENILSNAIKSLQIIDESQEAIGDKKLSHTLEMSLVLLRRAGLLPRDFSLDLVPHIREQIKLAWSSLAIHINQSSWGGCAYWGGDVVNALTLHSIALRDGNAHSIHEQSSFNDLAKVVLKILSLSLNVGWFGMRNWTEQISNMQAEIIALDVGNEVKADLDLALKRVGDGAKADKDAIVNALRSLIHSWQDAGWLSFSLVEAWSTAREKLLQVQGHLFQAIKKRKMDLEAVLDKIAQAHESVFSNYLYQNMPDGEVKEWLKRQEAILGRIHVNEHPRQLSNQTIEAWEHRYREFWLQFTRELDKQCVTRAGRTRRTWVLARCNMVKACQALMAPRCGEMLFTYDDINKHALLELLDKEWRQVYRHIVVKKDTEREKEYQKLRGQLISAKSELAAAHYLRSAQLAMHLSHTHNNSIYHWLQHASRGASALDSVIQKAQGMNILPPASGLVFQSTVIFVQASLQSYLAHFWRPQSEKQNHLEQILKTIMREREKLMLLNDKYTQDQAENEIMKQIRGLYERLESEHSKRLWVRFVRYWGSDSTDDYIDTWKQVYKTLSTEHRLNDFLVEARPAILLRLENVIHEIRRMKGYLRQFKNEQENAVTLLKSLKQAIQKHGYNDIVVANEFKRTLTGLEDNNIYKYRDFGNVFRACYEELQERGLITPIDPQTLLEEEMGKSMSEMHAEVERHRKGAAKAKEKLKKLNSRH